MHLKPKRQAEQRRHLYGNILHFVFQVLLNVTVSAAELLQTTLKLNGERGSPAASFQHTCIVSLEWTSQELSLLNFCQELSPRLTGETCPWLCCCLDRCFCKENNCSPVSSSDAHNTDVPLKTEGKNITVRIMPERGEAFDRLATVKGGLRQNEFVCLFPRQLRVNHFVCVGWLWCLLTLHLGTHTSEDAGVNRQTVQCFCSYLVDRCDTLICSLPCSPRIRFGTL